MSVLAESRGLLLEGLCEMVASDLSFSQIGFGEVSHSRG